MWCRKPDRGKLVEISEEWLVNFTTQKTIRDRKHERIVEKSAIGGNLAIKEIKPKCRNGINSALSRKTFRLASPVHQPKEPDHDDDVRPFGIIPEMSLNRRLRGSRPC
jgi:hypothetical protein